MLSFGLFAAILHVCCTLLHVLLRAQYRRTELPQSPSNRAAALRAAARTFRSPDRRGQARTEPSLPTPGGPEIRVLRCSLPAGAGREERGRWPGKAALGAATQKGEEGPRGFLLPEFTANGAAILARGGAGRRRTRERPTGRGAARGGAYPGAGERRSARLPAGRGEVPQPHPTPTPVLVRVSEGRFAPVAAARGRRAAGPITYAAA